MSLSTISVTSASCGSSEGLLVTAEAFAAKALQDTPVDELPHIAAWRDAYRSFAAKPQRTRNSLEALTRRAASGLPRVNRLTDIYNSISVRYQIPLGGEDLQQYRGSPRLVRAVGNEVFEVMSEGETLIEHPLAGEVIWCDEAGATCRIWNWRQTRRTQLQDETSAALFILDALDPLTDDELHAAAEDLISHIGRLGPKVKTFQRFISRN